MGCKDPKKVIQINENESVPNQLSLYLFPLSTTLSWPFCIHVSFLCLLSWGIEKIAWSHYLFTGNQRNPLGLYLPLVSFLQLAGKAPCLLPRQMMGQVFSSQDSWVGPGQWNDCSVDIWLRLRPGVWPKGLGKCVWGRHPKPGGESSWGQSCHALMKPPPFPVIRFLEGVFDRQIITKANMYHTLFLILYVHSPI